MHLQILRCLTGPVSRVFFAVVPWLWRGKYFSSGKEPAENSLVTPMLRHLMYKIKSTGPITVAEYMREVLTNPAKVGVPGQGLARCSSLARCEPAGGYAERGPRVLRPGSRVPSREEPAPKSWGQIMNLSVGQAGSSQRQCH